MSVRGKLFAVSVLLMVGVVLISGTYLEYSLRTWLEARAESDLWRHARTARDMIELSNEPATAQSLTSLAWRLGESSGARVTLIRPGGELLADSQLEEERVHDTENHLGRQEIQSALRRGRGMARRFSHTLETPMLYAALPFSRVDVQGVVRVAMSLGQVEDAVRKLRLMLAAAGLVGLAAAMFISGLASHYASRALQQLVEHAQKVTRGEGQRRVSVWGAQDAPNESGRGFNQSAQDLERVVSVLGHERDQIAAILDSMTEAVLALDAHHRLTLINGAGIELLGSSAAPLGTDLLHTGDNPALRSLVEKASDGTAKRDEFNVGERRVLARATPLSVSGGSVVVLHDITDLRHLEQVRRDFVANVSHELRTPVSVMRANAETLLNGALDDPKAAKPFVEALLRNAERLGRIIADLLDISRVEAGQLRLRTQVLPLATAALRAAEVVQPTATRKRLDLYVNIHDDIRVLGDAQALDQVLVNLLDNAVKYTPEGGHVDVVCETRGDRVRILVRDNGPGIALQHRNRIFERFYRIDPGRSRDMGGTGLGLSIVKHFCETMGGHIGVLGREPHGSIFWFDLPQAAADASVVARSA